VEPGSSASGTRWFWQETNCGAIGALSVKRLFDVTFGILLARINVVTKAELIRFQELGILLRKQKFNRNYSDGIKQQTLQAAYLWFECWRSYSKNNYFTFLMLR
jgi:hypothetical protein